MAYAVNVHVSQGMTAANGIIVISEREKVLNTTRASLVEVTRIADRATLVVDNVQALECDVSRNAGSKTSAIEAAETRKPPQRELEITRSPGWARSRDFER